MDQNNLTNISTMHPRLMKIGFDLDGVIYSNPLGVVRPVLKFLRQRILKKQSTGSYTPQTKMELFINYFYIKLSLITMRGYKDILKLIDDGKIEAYIVTSRHSAYEKEFNKSVKKLNQKNHFKQAVFNIKDLKPYEFKINSIKDLELDIYVEDNFDVVTELAKVFPDKIVWITNPVDKNLDYKLKFSNLKQFAKWLETAK